MILSVVEELVEETRSLEEISIVGEETLEIPPLEETLEKITEIEEETLEIATMEETPLSEITGIGNPSLNSHKFDHAQNLKTLEILSVEEVKPMEMSTMEETPGLEIAEIENPLLNPPQCDHTQNLKTLEEESTQGGEGKIEGTLTLKTLEKSSGGEGNIEDALNLKTLEKSSGIEIEIEDACTSEDIFIDDFLEQSVELDDDDGDDDDDDDKKRKGLKWNPYQTFPHPKLDHRDINNCDCGSAFCDQRRFREFHNSLSHFQTCNCSDPHCQKRYPFLMNRNPVFISRHVDDDDNGNSFTVRRSIIPLGFSRGNPKDSSSRFQGWKNEPPEPCPVGAGLANMGNTCFLNSIMQCFTHTVPFVQGLKSLKHESSSHCENEFCVLCAVRDQIEHSIRDPGQVIWPSNLVNNLSNFSSSFRRYQQEDAQEFLHCLVDKLESSWSNYEANARDSPSSSDHNLVKQVFGGRLVSQVRCSECGHISNSYEPVIDLSLEIEDVDNLKSALGSFTKVESIEDFRCQGCEQKVEVEKQLKLDRTPSIASFHLKRFKSDGIYVEKIDKMVAYPLELDLDPYSKCNEDENEELKYELFATVVHDGSSYSSGHYFSYIRSAPNAWYLFDDSDVCRVTEERALDQEAYILFYARKGTPWFSSLINTWRPKTSTSADTSPKSVLDPSSSVQQSSDPSSDPGPHHDDVSVTEEGAAGTSHFHHLPRVQEKLSSLSSTLPLSLKKKKDAVKYVKSKSKSMCAGRKQMMMVALMCSRRRKRGRQASYLRTRKRITCTVLA